MIRLRKYALGIAVLWTLLIGFFSWLDIRRVDQAVGDLALDEARGLFEKYLVFLSSDYMTPEFHKLSREGSGATEHLVGLRSSSPATAPDAWETSALEALKTGVREVSAVGSQDNAPYLHYMGPLTMREECLRCHADQEYGAGDLCGGISVSVPLERYLASARAQRRPMTLEYGGLWVLGLFGLGMSARSIGKRVAENREAEEALRESEERFRTITASAQDAIIMMDGEGRISFWNRAAERVFGW